MDLDEGPVQDSVPAPRLDDGARALVDAVRAEGHAALREPRALARFLCGLSSPAFTRARLGRHPRFGALEEWPFASVLAAAQGG